MQLVKSISVLHQLLYIPSAFIRLQLQSAESLPLASVLANSLCTAQKRMESLTYIGFKEARIKFPV